MHKGNKYHFAFVFWTQAWQHTVTSPLVKCGYFSQFNISYKEKCFPLPFVLQMGAYYLINWALNLFSESHFLPCPVLTWASFPISMSLLPSTVASSILILGGFSTHRQAILEQKILRELFRHLVSIFSFPVFSQSHVNQTFVLTTAQKLVFFQEFHELSHEQSWHHSCFLFDTVYHCFLLF